MKFFALSLLALPLLAAGFAYREALPGYHYQFPRDHFEHEDFRTEWWYYTGNVRDAAGKRFGFELVFFRLGERHDTDNASAWTLKDLYLAHAALTDANGKHFSYDERLNRSSPGIAGASFAEQRVWNGNWSARWNGEKQTLDAVTEHFQFHLLVEPEKPFVIHGENGVSQKAEGRGRASHYVSFPLLRVSGTIDGANVTGRAWMDHEWFTEQLAENQTGWDWFSVQLDNRTELMLFELRRKDGTIDPYSSGTFIDVSGKARHLKREDFTLEPLSRWNRYPVEWRIRVPSLGMDMMCKAVLQNQELRTRSGGQTYWEGAVDYSGSHTGVGYLEMTGYGRGVRFQ
ncbi:MAG TPA: lipocalin-like domain-containing protein [Bryobacteraceae bacterium]|nr:lipocalin-like domain-containing protein [Bryobacteraceae bacterium]